MSEDQSMKQSLSAPLYYVKRFPDIRRKYPTPMSPSEFGARLLLARKHAGLTQTALAKAVSMSQGAYAEAEKVGQGSAYTAQIARACGVSAEWLATGMGEMVPKTGSAFVRITHKQLEDLPEPMREIVENLALSLLALQQSHAEALAKMADTGDGVGQRPQIPTKGTFKLPGENGTSTQAKTDKERGSNGS